MTSMKGTQNGHDPVFLPRNRRAARHRSDEAAADR